MHLQRLRALLNEQGLSQKDVAARMVEWSEKNAPDDPLKLTTLTPKLSKLLGGDAEGRAYFSHGRRGEALAHGFNVPTDDIQGMLSRVELLLDPRLPWHAVEALRRQAAMCPERVQILPLVGDNSEAAGEPDTTPFGVVRVAGAAEGDRLALRDASDDNERAVVVLADDVDVAFFERCRRRVSFVRRVPRGYELALDPGLVPVPPPKPGALWRDGVPQISHPELTAWMRLEGAAARRGPYLSREATESDRILAAADERGEEPAFPLDGVEGWLAERELDEIVVPTRDYRRAETWLAEGWKSPEDNLVWWHEEVLYSIGPASQAFVEILGGHSVVVDPPAVRAARDALETRNPFENFADERGAMKAIGLSLDEALAVRRRSLFVLDREGIAASKDTFTLAPFSEDEEMRVRNVLRETAAREMCGVPAEWLGLPMYLNLAAQAELSPLPKEGFDVVHVLASLGAGRALRIRIAQFAGDGDGPLAFSPGRSVYRLGGSVKGTCAMDGDGTHVFIETLYDELLEGSSVRPRARRRKQAQDDADDD